LYTYGSGFSMNLGAIVKVNKEIRAGLAWESPTWYTLNDELKQNLSTTGFNYLDSNKVPIIGLSDANPDSNVTIKYPPYKLQTPSKVTGSFAYVFGKKGLISIDYAIKDYSNTKFKDNNEGSIRINQTMTEILDKTEEVRIGAEYRFKQFSFRAGHRREQSPYKNNWTVGNLRGYSVGVGYNFGDTKLDVSYNRNERTTNQGFFQQGLTDGAKIKSVNNTVALTLLFEL
jgi:long-subunit fatty acid transport protein